MLFSTQKGAGFTFNSFKVRLPFVESCQSATDTDQDAMLDVGFKVFLWFTFTVEFGCWVWGNSAPTSPIKLELITWSHGQRCPRRVWASEVPDSRSTGSKSLKFSLQDVAWSIIMGSQRI
jgi:hypothetical protein